MPRHNGSMIKPCEVALPKEGLKATATFDELSPTSLPRINSQISFVREFRVLHDGLQSQECNYLSGEDDIE